MEDVVVMGVGLHPFGKWPDKSTVELAEVAISAALKDSGIPFKDIQAAYLGAEFSGFFDARMIVQNFGWTGIPINQMQQACASSSAAFREAYQAVALGRYDVVLVAGYEKMEKGLIQGGSPDRDKELHLHYMGLDVTPARVAMSIKRRMLKYGDTPETLAAEAVQCFEYGSMNPNASNRRKITMEEVLNAPVICTPLTLLMCCPNSDGASAAVICSTKKAREYGMARAITVAGYAAGTPDHGELIGGPGAHIGSGSRTGNLNRRLSDELYEQTGIGPKDIDVLQCHTPFAGGGAICLESLGFCNEGEGAQFFVDGRTRIDGEIPFNTDGGLLARGHPLGATGVAEIFEIVRQLRGEAGALQIPGNPQIGMTHNSGLGCQNLHMFKK